MILKRTSKKKLLLLIGDAIIILASINIGSLIRIETLFNPKDFQKGAISITVIFFYVLSFYIFDLYNIRGGFLSARAIILYVGGLALAVLFITGFFLIFPYKFGRGIFFFSFVLTAACAFLWRVFFFSFFRLAVPVRNVLIVGAGKEGQFVQSVITSNPEYRVVGFLDDTQKKTIDEVNILGDSQTLEKTVSEYGIHDIILCDEQVGKKELRRALVNCRMRGVRIYDIPAFYELAMNKIPVLKIRDEWLLYCDGFEKMGSIIYKRSKRIMDLIVGAVLLIIFLPVIVFISFVIKVTSGGPVFLAQERYGENEKPFRMLKFRTMVKHAEKEEPKWAGENDPRVTRIGKFLRKMRADELPQLFNVLKGEMSLIGPRPEREFFVRTLMDEIPYYILRYAVKPGLTGWAQVNYRYGSTVEDALEKLQYELYYIKNQSLFLDLRILLKTCRVMLFGLGR